VIGQNTGTPKKWANTLQSWHIDAVLDIVLPISFGFHGGAGRENVLLKKKTPERTMDISCYTDRNENSLCRRCFLVFYPIPKALLTSEGSDKKQENNA
jgi:hypothetical protein